MSGSILQYATASQRETGLSKSLWFTAPFHSSTLFLHAAAMLFVATALENATLEDTLPAVEPSRIAAMLEELSGTVDPYITILLLVQTVIL